MMKSRIYAGVSILLIAYIASLGVYASKRQTVPERLNSNDPALVSAGQTVYANYCAACHGAQLEGQPDWRRAGPDGRLPAPPHDASGHTWHHPDDYLIHVVAEGIVAGVDRPAGYQGNMPAFAGVLSKHDTVAVLSYIKSTWPPDHRAWQEATNRPSTTAPLAGSAGSAPVAGSR